jgi:hypothetical protein
VYPLQVDDQAQQLEVERSEDEIQHLAVGLAAWVRVESEELRLFAEIFLPCDENRSTSTPTLRRPVRKTAGGRSATGACRRDCPSRTGPGAWKLLGRGPR